MKPNLPSNSDNTLLRPAEAAAFLRISRRTLDRWHACGFGPPRAKVGHKIYYRLSDIDSWLERLLTQPVR